MKSDKVHLIKFQEVPKESDDQFFNDLAQVLDTEDEGLFGFTESEDIFVRLLPSKLSEIFCVLKKWKYKFTVHDVTKEVLSGKMQKEYPEVQETTPDIFNSFRLENATIDEVLDKINEAGIESLDEIDRQILTKA